MHQPRVAAHVIIDGGQLDELAEESQRARRAEVLVPDDGLGDGLGLALRRAELLADEVERQKAAVELEGELRRAEVGGCGADVVQEGGDRQRRARQRLSVLGELLLEDRRT